MGFIKSKAFVGFLCFILGAGGMVFAQHLVAHRRVAPSAEPKTAPKSEAFPNMSALFNQFYNDDFFDTSRDPFKEMQRMRESVMKNMNEAETGGNVFDSWYQKRFGGDVGEIKRREDKKFIYYDIAIKGVDKKNLDFKVDDGQVDISGKTENRSDSNGTQAFFSSTFHRSFPLPPNVDPQHMKIEQSKDLVTLEFPKLS